MRSGATRCYEDVTDVTEMLLCWEVLLPDVSVDLSRNVGIVDVVVMFLPIAPFCSTARARARCLPSSLAIAQPLSCRSLILLSLVVLES